MENNLTPTPGSPLSPGSTPTPERKIWAVTLVIILVFLAVIFLAVLIFSKLGQPKDLPASDRAEIMRQLQAEADQAPKLSEAEKVQILQSIQADDSGPTEAEKVQIIKQLQNN
ncbi:MAG: hypothetical protein A2571_00425 [Candidatus Vogelbacteria bacterium RIFOXYD1_FULL_44_32]|uniref:Uncharacterized protein n=1 Tax=Candidatus Vogelbacteria bacterium RIFOXYD1_FULL_44_32 TaxID=1802438 RepID=A0A1G2QE96_9BACT|nr:MAG: hypothetical protein A2571_00425 [Candidatus Vogelbacteria bacterium RIFOXYD1_FULL_44_32]